MVYLFDLRIHWMVIQIISNRPVVAAVSVRSIVTKASLEIWCAGKRKDRVFGESGVRSDQLSVSCFPFSVECFIHFFLGVEGRCGQSPFSCYDTEGDVLSISVRVCVNVGLIFFPIPIDWLAYFVSSFSLLFPAPDLITDFLTRSLVAYGTGKDILAVASFCSM